MTRPASPLTRRRFLAGTAAAAATPLILTPTTLAASRRTIRKDDPDVLRVGLVGCGGRGTGAALQALSAEDGTVVLVAMGDAFADRLDSSHANLLNALGQERAGRVQVDAEHRFVGFDAFKQVMDSDIDVVLLATPPHFRPEHLRYAVEHDLHVFTEKPMAVDGPGVRHVHETCELASAKGLALVSGFCWRSNVRHRAFYERIHDGAIGDLRAVYSTYNATPLGTNPRQDGWTDMEWQLRNWQHFDWLSGDHLVEQAVHSIDKQGWTFKDTPPLQCTAIGGRQAREGAERGNIYDHFSVTYDYPEGVKAFHMCRQMANCSNENSDYIYGAKGTAEINGWANQHIITGPDAWRYEGPGNDMYQAEHDELFASIRAGSPRDDGTWMLRSTMLAIMGRMAAYTGQTITWDQAWNSAERLGPETYRWDGELSFAPVPIPGRTKFA